MFDDLDDVVVWFVIQGIIKNGDIVIFGYFYGGFVVVVVIVCFLLLFKCVIVGVFVVDLGWFNILWSDNCLQCIL